MTDRDALLAAVLARPEDDLPRVVFADWLEEHDEPEYAEFVRVQCEVAAIFRQPGPPRLAQPLIERAVDLLREYGPGWVRGTPLAGIIGASRSIRADEISSGSSDLIWHRGFVRSLWVWADYWIKNGNAILERHPVRQVRLRTWPVVRHHTSAPGDRWSWLDGEAGRVSDDDLKAFMRPGETRYAYWELHFRRRWPGVEFEPPDYRPTKKA